MKYLLIFITAILPLSGKALYTRAFHVEDKLFEPTYKAALSGDESRLETVFEKLSKLGKKEQRVKVLLSDSLETSLISDSQYRFQSVGQIEVKQIFKTSGLRAYDGCRLGWSPFGLRPHVDQMREYQLNYLSDPRTHHHISLKLIDNLRTKWTLSAVVRYQGGGMFLFEKISEEFATITDPPNLFAAISLLPQAKMNVSPHSWWKTQLKPSFLLVEAKAERENTLKYKQVRLLEGANNTIDTESEFNLSCYKERAKPYTSQVKIRSIIKELPRFYRVHSISAGIQHDNTIGSRSILGEKIEGAYKSSGQGEIKRKGLKKKSKILVMGLTEK